MARISTSHPRTAEPPFWAMLLLSTLLTLTLGVGLALFQYQQQSKAMLSTGQSLFALITEHLEQGLIGLYQPPAQALNLLATSRLTSASSLEERLDYLPQLAQVLIDNPQLNSLYQGWSNGDYLMLRPLRSPELRVRFAAPEQAEWMVWHIQSPPFAAATVHLFLDTQLQQIERRYVAFDGFDPRHRLWYQQASSTGGQVITTPYIFFSTGEFGTTLARPAAGGAVLGADLTLGQLSSTLAGLKVTPHAELLIYDGEGTVIAYQDATRLLEAAQGTTLRLKRFHELGSTLLARLAEDGYRQERVATLPLEGERWVLSQSRITLNGMPETYLAILVPEAELLDEAYRIRSQSVFITLVASFILLPLLWLGSHRLWRARG